MVLIRDECRTMVLIRDECSTMVLIRDECSTMVLIRDDSWTMVLIRDEYAVTERTDRSLWRFCLSVPLLAPIFRSVMVIVW